MKIKNINYPKIAPMKLPTMKKIGVKSEGITSNKIGQGKLPIPMVKSVEPYKRKMK